MEKTAEELLQEFKGENLSFGYDFVISPKYPNIQSYKPWDTEKKCELGGIGLIRVKGITLMPTRSDMCGNQRVYLIISGPNSLRPLIKDGDLTDEDYKNYLR